MMASRQPLFEKLEDRRLTLGLSQSALADLSGISLPTVHRILSGHGSAASVENIQAIAEVLGMDLEAVPRISTNEILERQARKKAERLVRMVQGTSALEGQGVSGKHIGQMINKTIEELMSGSRRRLWSR